MSKSLHEIQCNKLSCVYGRNTKCTPSTCVKWKRTPFNPGEQWCDFHRGEFIIGEGCPENIMGAIISVTVVLRSLTS